MYDRYKLVDFILKNGDYDLLKLLLIKIEENIGKNIKITI